MDQIVSSFVRLFGGPDTYLGAIIVGVMTAGIVGLLTIIFKRWRKYIPGNEEYEQRRAEQRARDIRYGMPSQENAVLFNRRIGNCEFSIFSGDIVTAKSDVLVSSDDTQLSAAGGVAAAIAKVAGSAIKKRLRQLARAGVWRGSIAITDGGATSAKYIFHAVVLDKTPLRTVYPEPEDISAIARRVIHTADCVGAQSIALPVLASGTAAKNFDAKGLGHHEVTYIVAKSIIEAMSQGLSTLKEVSLIIFRNDLFNDDVKTRLERQFA